MIAQPKFVEDHLATARAQAASCRFHPTGTVRCNGVSLFRSEFARDLGCLLDLDPAVLSWSCLPMALVGATEVHVPDFLVERNDGRWVQNAVSRPDRKRPSWIDDAARAEGLKYSCSTVDEIYSGFRLVNARDLLRYARWHCPLGDRVRLLAALEDQGSMTFAECLPAFQETRPTAGLASLILHRFVEADLDDARIGPETIVRRCRS